MIIAIEKKRVVDTKSIDSQSFNHNNTDTIVANVKQVLSFLKITFAIESTAEILNLIAPKSFVSSQKV